MFSYESGIAYAFLLWAGNVVWLIISINSRIEKNLNRISQRLSWFTLSPKPIYLEDQNRSTFSKVLRFLLIIGIGLPFVMANWFYVALIIGQFFYNRLKDFGAPQTVREFRWKMRNIDMPFDQIMKEMMKSTDQDLSDFEKFKSDFIAELEERGVTYG